MASSSEDRRVFRAVSTNEGTAAAYQASIAEGHRILGTVMILGLLGAGKTQLIANVMREGSLEQQLAFSEVTHDQPAAHPMGFFNEQTYTLQCDETSLKLIDTPGIEPGLGAETLRDDLSERMFTTEMAASVDQVWLCVPVDTPKNLNANKVQALLAQLEQANLPTIIILTKADSVFLKELFTGAPAAERSSIESIIEDLKTRFTVIKDHVYISTWRHPPYVSLTQRGNLKFPQASKDLVLTTVNQLEKSKFAAFCRHTAANLDAKMASSAEAILCGIRWRLAFVVVQPIPLLPEMVGVPIMLQKTFSRVYAVWGMDEKFQKIISKQLLNSKLSWKVAGLGVLKVAAFAATLGISTAASAASAAAVTAAAAAEVAAQYDAAFLSALAVGSRSASFCSLVHDTIQLGLTQTGVLVQLSLLTGGDNSALSKDPDAEKKVEAAVVAYKSKHHERVMAFCKEMKNKYVVFTEAQIQLLEKQLHQFLRELCSIANSPATEDTSNK